MCNDDKADLVRKGGADKEHEREEMLLKDLRTQITPSGDCEPCQEERRETSKGGEESEAFRAAGADDILRAISLIRGVSIMPLKI